MINICRLPSKTILKAKEKNLSRNSRVYKLKMQGTLTKFNLQIKIKILLPSSWIVLIRRVVHALSKKIICKISKIKSVFQNTAKLNNKLSNRLNSVANIIKSNDYN